MIDLVKTASSQVNQNKSYVLTTLATIHTSRQTLCCKAFGLFLMDLISESLYITCIIVLILYLSSLPAPQKSFQSSISLTALYFKPSSHNVIEAHCHITESTLRDCWTVSVAFKSMNRMLFRPRWPSSSVALFSWQLYSTWYWVHCTLSGRSWRIH